MFGMSAAVRVYIATAPADMRKSFDGLFALASSLDLDPLSGHLFVFINKRRDRIKILYWDRDGLAVWAKTQTTDYPQTYWWNTPTLVGHNRSRGAAPTRGVVPTATDDYDTRRITMLGRPRPTAPPRPERPTHDR